MRISFVWQSHCFHSLLLLILTLVSCSRAIIFFQGRTTACDICDRVSTMSVRNTMCCLKFSKCCMPDSLDEYNAQAAREDALGHSNYPAKVHTPRTDSEIAAAQARTRAAKLARRKSGTATAQKRRRAAAVSKGNSKKRASSSSSQRQKDRVVTIEGW